MAPEERCARWTPCGTLPAMTQSQTPASDDPLATAQTQRLDRTPDDGHYIASAHVPSAPEPVRPARDEPTRAMSLAELLAEDDSTGTS